MSLRDKPYYPVIYMFLVTAVFSSVLIGFARYTEDRVQANQELMFEKAVLEAFGLAEGTAAEIHDRFVQRIRPPKDAEVGAYRLVGENDQVEGYAVPIGGKGFWAPIRGIVGLKPDRQTITGISFYEQNETPGLGAEITRPWFRQQFAGKELADGPEAIQIVPPAVPTDENSVHGVTGATQTSVRLEILINESMQAWRQAQREGRP